MATLTQVTEKDSKSEAKHVREEVDLYRRLGLCVIPVLPRTKQPLVEWRRYQTVPPSDQELQQWFSNGQNNIGIVCGGVSGDLYVLDLDDPALLHEKPLAEIADKTMMVRTSRGLHLYLKSLLPARITHRPSYHLDLIGDGGFVVAPPSVHPDGTQYEFASEVRSILEVDDVNKVVEWLDEKYNYHSDATFLEKPLGDAGIVEGERNDQLFRFATVDRELGLPIETAIARGEALNRSACRPSLPLGEVSTLVHSAYSRPYFENAAQKIVNGEQSRIYFDADGKFIPKRLADELLAIHDFRTMMDTKEIFIYTDGMWQPTGEPLIHGECMRRLGDRTSAHNTNEVLHYIQGMTYVNRELFNADLDLINLENGVLNVQTSQLEPHSPEYLFTYKLPLIYDAEAKCPEIEKFLIQVQPDEKHRQGMIELAGYCLYRAYLLHLSWMLTGNGANGKSTYINLLKSLLDSANVVSISLHELEENRFAKANLYGKLANLYPDLPSRAVYQTGQFKMCTGADPLTGEKKFRNAFNFVNHAKFVFSANTVPRSPNDDSDAFFRRWIIVPFPNKFEGEKADTRILAKLTTPTELSGLLNLALKALREVLQRGSFTNDEPTEEKRTRYVRLSDPVASFVMDCIDVSPEGFIAKDLLYVDFVEYCKQNHYVILPKNTFHKALIHEVPVSDYRPEVDKIRIYAWKGISLRSEEDKRKDKRGTLDDHL